MTAVALLVGAAAVMLLWAGLTNPPGGIAGQLRQSLGGRP